MEVAGSREIYAGGSSFLEFDDFSALLWRSTAFAEGTSGVWANHMRGFLASTAATLS